MPERDGYEIRRAREEDLETLAAMRLRMQAHLEAGTPGLARLSQERVAALPAFYGDYVHEADRRAVVAAQSGSDVPVAMAVGVVQVLPDIMPSRYGRVDDVWVEPAHRHRGLCKRLLRELLDFFREQRVDRVVLHYAPGNEEAKATWTRLGFVPFEVSAQAPWQTVWDSVADRD